MLVVKMMMMRIPMEGWQKWVRVGKVRSRGGQGQGHREGKRWTELTKGASQARPEPEPEQWALSFMGQGWFNQRASDFA